MSKADSVREGENTVFPLPAVLRFCVFGQHGLQAAGGCLESGAQGSARRERPRPRSLSRGRVSSGREGEKKGCKAHKLQERDEINPEQREPPREAGFWYTN